MNIIRSDPFWDAVIEAYDTVSTYPDDDLAIEVKRGDKRAIVKSQPKMKATFIVIDELKTKEPADGISDN